jgi:hypothetical protein
MTFSVLPLSIFILLKRRKTERIHPVSNLSDEQKKDVESLEELPASGDE